MTPPPDCPTPARFTQAKIMRLSKTPLTREATPLFNGQVGVRVEVGRRVDPTPPTEGGPHPGQGNRKAGFGGIETSQIRMAEIDRSPMVLVQITGVEWDRMVKLVPTFHLSFGLETVNIDKRERAG